MNQPTAEEALKRLEPLVGEWTLEARPPDGPPWPGDPPEPTSAAAPLPVT